MDDHPDFHNDIYGFKILASDLLNISMSVGDRKAASATLKKDLPFFFWHFLDHSKSEEKNLQPIGRKHIPIEIQKQVSLGSSLILRAPGPEK